MSGTARRLGHCTALRLGREHTGRVGRTKGRPKLTGSTVDAHAHTRRRGFMHLNRCTYIHKQTDRHLPSSQHLIWVIAISGKNTALGHTSPPALPPFYSPHLPCSLLPSGLPRHHSSPLSFLRQHYTSRRFQPVFNLDNFPNLLFQPSLRPLCASFPPRTLGCVTLVSCLADKVTVS